MATVNNGESVGCIFRWEIKNISRCWLETGERIESPIFTAIPLKNTEWTLRFYPMGYSEQNSVTLQLYRKYDSSEWYYIEVSYTFAFISQDDSILLEKSSKDKIFLKNLSGIEIEEDRRKIFLNNRDAFIQDDTLRIQCKILKKGSSPSKFRHLSARTVFKANRTAFLWKIDDLNSGERSRFKDDLIEFDIVVKETSERVQKLDIINVSFKESIKQFNLKISVVNSYGEEEECVAHQCLADEFKAGASCTLLHTNRFTDNKSRYFQNNTLVLACEYVTSDGSFLHETSSFGIVTPKPTETAIEEKSGHNAGKKPEQTLVLSEEKQEGKSNSQLTPVLASDLKSLYNDGILSDVELRTPTQKFSAHKIILSARSPVFRKMFSSDMKEKNSGYVVISDLEDDTVHRMLLYIYTDSLKDIELEHACNLYAASDKYEIMSLRSRCSSFLKDHLCSEKACDVLALADRHQDDVLKSFVQDFILSHDKEVFGSQEWKNFMATNLQLAADVMYRKVFPF